MEAYYVETVAEWHEATDGRGLTELERCHKNYVMQPVAFVPILIWPLKHLIDVAFQS